MVLTVRLRAAFEIGCQCKYSVALVRCGAPWDLVLIVDVSAQLFAKELVVICAVTFFAA